MIRHAFGQFFSMFFDLTAQCAKFVLFGSFHPIILQGNVRPAELMRIESISDFEIQRSNKQQRRTSRKRSRSTAQAFIHTSPHEPVGGHGPRTSHMSLSTTLLITAPCLSFLHKQTPLPASEELYLVGRRLRARLGSPVLQIQRADCPLKLEAPRAQFARPTKL